MDASVQNYKGIVIDASFFVRPFSENFKQILADTPVYHAQTWENAVAAMDDGLEEPHKRFYKDNVAVIMQTNPRVPDGVPCTEDVVGLLRSLAGMGHRYLFASADLMLIQRLILERVQIDIYNLWTDSRIQAEQFPKLAGTFEFAQADWNPVPTAQNEKELVLYDETGSPVRLNRTKDGGSEATMYTCPDKPELLAKIYKEKSKSLNEGKIKNIEKLRGKFQENPGFSWAKVPREKLYLEPERRNVVGFLMEKTGEGTLLSELDLLNDEKDDIEIHRVVRLCRTLIRQVACLSIYGFCVYDYNDNNFSYSHSKPGCVQMMDTDSFCGGDYFIEFHSPDLYYKRKYVSGVTGKAEALRICTEFAYVYAGHILRRGDNVLTPAGELHKAESSIWRLIPPNMRELLFRVLGGGMEYLPQFDLLLSELVKAEQVLHDEAKKGEPKTYRMLEEEEEEAEDQETEDAPEPSPEPKKYDGNHNREPSEKADEEDWEDPSEFDEFEVDDAVFQPTDRMQIQQAPPAKGPQKRADTKEYHFAPAPLRTLYGQQEEDDRADRDAARWQSAKRGMKIAAVVFAVLFVSWWLFVADPDWLIRLRETVFGALEWLREQWENLTKAVGGLVEKIGQLLPRSDR